MTSALAAGAVIVWLSGVCAGAGYAEGEPTPQPSLVVAGEQKPDPDAPKDKNKHDEKDKQGDKDKQDKADEQDNDDAHGKSSGRLFGLFPNHTAVEGATDIEPVSAGQKFKMAGLNTFDPVIYAFVGVMAAVNRNYGPGASGYFQQYAASFTDNTVGNMLTTAVLPSMLHQDPRYFQRGSGRTMSRVGYAASRSVVTRGDSGHHQFNASELGGTALAAGISNTYYPVADRTVSGTLTRWGLQVMWDTLSNELKEFWPDVRKKIHGD